MTEKKDKAISAEEYSPRWLLERILNSKSDAEALLSIIEFQHEASKHYAKSILPDLNEMEKEVERAFLQANPKSIDRAMWVASNVCVKIRNKALTNIEDDNV